MSIISAVVLAVLLKPIAIDGDVTPAHTTSNPRTRDAYNAQDTLIQVAGANEGKSIAPFGYLRNKGRSYAHTQLAPTPRRPHSGAGRSLSIGAVI